jgi:hypothetical protein
MGLHGNSRRQPEDFPSLAGDERPAAASSSLPPPVDDNERAAEIIHNLRDALRYRRLRVLGCAIGGTQNLKLGMVSRFTNLDEAVDADLITHPSRGEASSSPTKEV